MITTVTRGATDSLEQESHPKLGGQTRTTWNTPGMRSNVKHRTREPRQLQRICRLSSVGHHHRSTVGQHTVRPLLDITLSVQHWTSHRPSSVGQNRPSTIGHHRPSTVGYHTVSSLLDITPSAQCWTAPSVHCWTSHRPSSFGHHTIRPVLDITVLHIQKIIIKLSPVVLGQILRFYQKPVDR